MTQRKLSALRIGNFKAFADTQRIPLKPITLIFGPNSAGKSSVIHSLAFVHEAQFGRPKRDRSRLDVYKTELGGASIDLGGFSQFVYAHDIGREVEWGAEISVEDRVDYDTQSKQRRLVTVSVLVGAGSSSGEDGSRQRAPSVQGVRITVDGEELVRASYRETYDDDTVRLRLDALNIRHPRVQTTLGIAAFGANTNPKDFSPGDLAQVINRRISGGKISLFVDGLINFRIAAPSISDERGNDVISPGHANQDPETYFWWMLRYFLENCSNALAHVYGVMEYLGPIRALPPRHFTPGDFDESTWNAGGGQAWDRVSHDAMVRDAVNAWLSKPEFKTTYRLKVRELIDPDEIESTLMSELAKEHSQQQPMTALERRELFTKGLAAAHAELNERYEYDQRLSDEASRLVEKWTKRLGLAKSPAEREDILQEAEADLERWEQSVLEEAPEVDDQELAHEVLNEDAHLDEAHVKAASFVQRLKKNGSVTRTPQLTLRDVGKRVDVSHRDVGTGISQVLPVLVAAYGSKEQIIAIEQPEIHLHPALQAELGDVFIESALGERGNTFILETHSEHLILRMLKKVREKKISPADMCVLFVEPTDHGSQVKELEYDVDGEFIDRWPGGFFAERAKELF